MQLARDQLQADYDKLKTEEQNKEKQLLDLSQMSDKREQAKQDLKVASDKLIAKFMPVCSLRISIAHITKILLFHENRRHSV